MNLGLTVPFDTDTDLDFRDALVFLSEEAQFHQQSDREALGDILRSIANENIRGRRPNSEQVVWAAVRRYASLLPQERIDELLPFLTHSGCIDARLVALQGILSAFEFNPAASSELPRLRDRVYEIAVKLIDADVLTPGDTSAILELSICSLLALSDPRFEDCMQRVQELNWPWLTSQILRGVSELREVWEQNRLEDRNREPIYRIATNVGNESADSE